MSFYINLTRLVLSFPIEYYDSYILVLNKLNQPNDTTINYYYIPLTIRNEFFTYSNMINYNVKPDKYYVNLLGFTNTNKYTLLYTGQLNIDKCIYGNYPYFMDLFSVNVPIVDTSYLSENFYCYPVYSNSKNIKILYKVKKDMKLNQNQNQSQNQNQGPDYVNLPSIITTDTHTLIYNKYSKVLAVKSLDTIYGNNAYGDYLVPLPDTYSNNTILIPIFGYVLLNNNGYLNAPQTNGTTPQTNGTTTSNVTDTATTFNQINKQTELIKKYINNDKLQQMINKNTNILIYGIVNKGANLNNQQNNASNHNNIYLPYGGTLMGYRINDNSITLHFTNEYFVPDTYIERSLKEITYGRRDPHVYYDDARYPPQKKVTLEFLFIILFNNKNDITLDIDITQNAYHDKKTIVGHVNKQGAQIYAMISINRKIKYLNDTNANVPNIMVDGDIVCLII